MVDKIDKWRMTCQMLGEGFKVTEYNTPKKDGPDKYILRKDLKNLLFDLYEESLLCENHYEDGFRGGVLYEGGLQDVIIKICDELNLGDISHRNIF